MSLKILVVFDIFGLAPIAADQSPNKYYVNALYTELPHTSDL